MEIKSKAITNKSTSIIDYENYPGIFMPTVIKGLEKWGDFLSHWTQLSEIEQMVQFMKGDIVGKLAIKFGESSISKFAQEVGENENTLVAYRRVARAFPPPKRGLNVSWTHYLSASQADSWDRTNKEFKTKKRFKWLDKAHDEGWTVRRLQKEIKIKNEGGEYTIFQRYMDYLQTFRNIFLNSKRDKLRISERKQIAEGVEDLSLKLQKYVEINLGDAED